MTQEIDHLNPAEQLPPVDCPLLIELEPGLLVPAARTTFVESKGREMEYRLNDGTLVLGRYRWTYP